MKIGIFGLLTVLGLGALIYFGPDIKEHFGKRYASADREIFEKSKPFVHGSIENLARLKMQSRFPLHLFSVFPMPLAKRYEIFPTNCQVLNIPAALSPIECQPSSVSNMMRFNKLNTPS